MGRGPLGARALAGAAVCLAATLGLAVYVGRASAPPAIDRATAAWIHERRLDSLDAASRTVALLGGSVALGMLVLMSCVLVRRRARPRWLAFLIASYVGVEVLFWLMKLAVDRPRPPLSLRVATVASSSYPSGHTAVATAVGASLLVAAWGIRAAPLRRLVVVALLVLPLVVGLSRLVLGVHWLTDVVGGFLLGLGWVLLCLAIVLRDDRAAWPPDSGGAGRVTRPPAPAAAGPNPASAPRLRR